MKMDFVMSNISNKYDDMIQYEYPRPDRNVTKHPPMDREKRAKIFVPFAALKGYEEAILDQQKQHVINT